MTNTQAKILSYLLHPLFMPFYAMALIMNLNTYIAFSLSPQVQRVVLVIVFVTTAVLPVLTAVLLLQKGAIRSLEMATRAERRIPFITSAVYYLVCYYLLQQLPVPRLLSIMVLAATAAIFVSWLISFQWKVSIHMVGVGGLAGLLFAIAQILGAPIQNLIILSLLLAGLLGFARLTLDAHTPAQIYSGFLIGFFLEWLLVTGMSA